MHSSWYSRRVIWRGATCPTLPGAWETVDAYFSNGRLIDSPAGRVIAFTAKREKRCIKGLPEMDLLLLDAHEIS